LGGKEASKMNEAHLVRIEANLRHEGFVGLVAGGAENWEEGLRFLALHAALGRPGWEDFAALSAKRFILEAELQDEAEVAAFRNRVEAALNALGADWMIGEMAASKAPKSRVAVRTNWD
jgi:hypothetical protein